MNAAQTFTCWIFNSLYNITIILVSDILDKLGFCIEERYYFLSRSNDLCTADQSPTSGYMIRINTSTVTVVVATSCGVMGFLVLVMLLVALKRHVKPSGRLCPPVLPGGGQPGSGGAVPQGIGHDEHDRLALIAFADDNRGGSSGGGSVTHVPLPTYEEATRAGHLSAGVGGLAHFGAFGGEGSRTSSIRSSHSRGDYRPLPRHER